MISSKFPKKFCIVFFSIFMAANFVDLFSTSLFAQQKSSQIKAQLGQSASIHIKNGKEQLEKKQFAHAVRSFSTALRRDPTNGEAYLLRGMAYDQMGNPAAAIKDFSRYIEINPKDPVGYIRRGDASNFNLDHEAAVQDYNAAIRLDPSSAEAYLGRGLAYTGLQKYNDAIKDYQWVLKISPKNIDALINMGIVCMLAGRSMQAMTYFERALELEKDPQWRNKIEKFMQKILQQAQAGGTKPAIPNTVTPPSKIKNLW